MPIALLLQETVYTFRWGAYHLEPWSHLVQTEETLIDRARSAFLVHWFGARLPLNGSFLNVVIDNLKQLREHYFAVTRAVSPEPTGPNLTEPLAGLVGEIAGIALSPTGTILALAVMVRNIPYWLHVLLNALGWKIVFLPFEPLLGPVVAPALLPLALFGGLAFGIKNPPEARAAYDLLGAAARLIIAAVGFIKLLMGPRQKIGNPILLAILDLFDKLAGLFPYVLALVVIIVTRIGPLLEPLAKQVEAFTSLFDQVVATVTFIFEDVPGTIQRYWPTIASTVSFVLTQLMLLFPMLIIAFTQLFVDMKLAIDNLISKVSDDITDWYKTASALVRGIILDQPLIKNIRAARVSFGVATHTLGSSSSTSSASSGTSVPAILTPKITSPDTFLKAMGGPPPGGLGAIAILGKIDAKYGGALFGDYLPPFSPAAQRAIERARRPRSLFAEERQELVTQLGKLPEQALAELRVEQLKLRDLLTTVVGRILPPEMRIYMGSLLEMFGALDKSLYGLKVAKPDYPVRDLPDNGLLRPVVRRLIIRSAGGTRSDLNDFQTRLQLTLTKQLYPAPAEA
jgi:hypothetical protein